MGLRWSSDRRISSTMGSSSAYTTLPINNFVEELPKLGELLDFIEKNYGKVIAVIPNIGLTRTSILLGTSFQGVKGFAVIYRKTNS